MMRAGLPARALSRSRSMNCDEPAVHVERRDHQFFQAGITGKTGERVEHGRHFLRQLRIRW